VNIRSSAQRLLPIALLLLAATALPSSAHAMLLRPAEAAPATVQQAERTSDVRLDSPVFRLVVPFRTQKDGSRWQGSNCGPAALGMILDGFGIADQATDDLRFRAHTYQGTVGMRTGTALDHIAHVANDFGVDTHGLYNPDGSWRHWEIADVVSELRQGHPVVPLVRLYQVPGYESSLPRWGHYIILTGIAPGGFYFSDPLKIEPVAGTSGFISEWQLKSAIDNSHIPGQAVAFSGPRDLPVWLPDR
jgi:hypothetical protein